MATARFDITYNNTTYSILANFDGYASGACDKITIALLYIVNPKNKNYNEFDINKFIVGLLLQPYMGLVPNDTKADFIYQIFKSETNDQIIIKVNDVFSTKLVFYGRLKDFISANGEEIAISRWNEWDVSRNKLPMPDPKAKARQAALAKLTVEEKKLLGLT